MKNSLNRLLEKYYWIPIIAIAFLGSWWLGIRAWDNLHTSRLVDIFWNPTLHMWEPVYYSALPEWIYCLLLAPTMAVEWWYAPIYFQLPYTLSVLYSLLLFEAHRPCIDVSSGRVGDEK